MGGDHRRCGLHRLRPAGGRGHGFRGTGAAYPHSGGGGACTGGRLFRLCRCGFQGSGNTRGSGDHLPHHRLRPFLRRCLRCLLGADRWRVDDGFDWFRKRIEETIALASKYFADYKLAHEQQHRNHFRHERADFCDCLSVRCTLAS
ncbi:hypothetical protein AGR1B_Cc10315 [Agrobacterium fabacearum S56]|nr:hypothetical protein AGR1B_Cc10315 [Agrobacterium fabacearum S56]